MQPNGDETYELYRKQDFYKTRQWCLQRGVLFQDPHFQLNDKYEWLRPWEITDNPQLYVNGIARFDVVQGSLGDCWALAGIAALGVYPELVRKVIPLDQSFTAQYAGIFHFHIWRFGKWYDVVIDDRLPTTKKKLAFVKSVYQNEFWTVLLEKAYCKILGGNYDVANGGNLCESLEDFTGGIVEQYSLKRVPKNFNKLLEKSVARRSLVGCFINPKPSSIEARTSLGLVRGHSYSVTGAKTLDLSALGHGSVDLVRVRNPWGNFEWKGSWSKDSPEWKSVPENMKQELGLVHKDDGEFFMTYSDFVSNFQWLDMCHLSPEVFTDAQGKQDNVFSWDMDTITGNWVRGITAGGANDMYKNPQILFTLSEADDDNDDGFCSVLFALMQRVKPREYNGIGFKVFKLHDPNQTTVDQSFFKNNKPVAEVPVKKVREIAQRFHLAPGGYCVVPFTSEAGKEGEFILRVYAEKKTDINQLFNQTLIAHKKVRKKAAVENSEFGNVVGDVPSSVLDVNKAGYYDTEVDWKDLKTVLDNAVKEKNLGYGHFLLDTGARICSLIFRKPQKKSAFETVGPEGFSYDVCRSIVALLDVDHSGKLGYKELQDMWTEITKWKYIYETHCDQTDGYLNSSGLKDALEAAGFHFKRQILSDIVHRYSTKDDKISFDDFLHCAIKIKAMAEFFYSKEENQSNKVQLTLEEFVDKALYS